MKELGDALGRITYIGIAAMVFFVVVKLLMTRWPLPGIKDIVAMA